jgi:hypothetical protein
MWVFLSITTICLTILFAQIIHYSLNPEASASGKRVSSVPEWDATAKLPGDIPGGPTVHPGDSPYGFHGASRSDLN